MRTAYSPPPTIRRWRTDLRHRSRCCVSGSNPWWLAQARGDERRGDARPAPVRVISPFIRFLPVVYVAGELNSTVSFAGCDDGDGCAVGDADAPTLFARVPRRELSRRHSRRAERTRAFVSNRGQNSDRGVQHRPRDRHAQFQQTMSTGGDWPRNFTLDPRDAGCLPRTSVRIGRGVPARCGELDGWTATSRRIEVPEPRLPSLPAVTASRAFTATACRPLVAPR